MISRLFFDRDYMYDVIISGAGVAGARLAKGLESLDVLVIDPIKRPGLKDSGHVSSNIFKFYPDVRVLATNNEIEISGRAACSRIVSDGITYIIDRRRFSRQIRKGLDIAHEFVTGVRKAGKGYAVTTNKSSYKARMVVGADGVSSPVRKSAGIRAPKTIYGMFGFGKKKQPVRVYMDKRISKYFLGWRTPIGEYGVADVTNPRHGLSQLCAQEHVSLSDFRFGAIPVGMVRPQAGKIFLVGDSAGMVKPVTGGGIIYSTMAADLLARLISNSKEKEYASRIKRLIGFEIFAGKVFREMYYRMPQSAVDLLVKSLNFHGNDFDYDFLLSFLKAFLKYKIEGVGIWKRH